MGNRFRDDTGACIRDEAAGQKGWWAVCAASACKASYRDGRTPELSPAYDVVAYSAFIGGSGHALPFVSGGAKRSRVTPAVVRELCNNVRGLHEPQAHATIRQTVRLACEAWPAMVEASSLRPEQKTRLLSHFQAAPLVDAWEKRIAKRGTPPRHG